MVETERLTFAVTTTGVGRPDYSPAIGVERSLVGPLQTELIVSREILSVAAETMSEVYLYEVPDRYNLNVGSLTISCTGSLLQRLVIWSSYLTPPLNGLDFKDLQFDMRIDLDPSDLGTIVIKENRRLGLDLHNNDSVARTFYVTLVGYLERIE